MEKKRVDFLRRFMDTTCPTGYEEEAGRAWREEAGRFADRTWTDVHGSVIAVLNEDAPFRVMIAGHLDEIGLMVTYVDDSGFLSFTGLGGWDMAILPGQRVRIQAAKGPILGVIGRKPPHLMKEEDRKVLPKFEDLWIDVGVTSKASALKLVSIGDAAVLDYGMTEMRDGLLVGRGIDDRIGAFVALEALRLLKEMKTKLGIYAVATVQEEIGSRGAQTSGFGIDPQVGIAIDVGFCTDHPGMDEARKRWGDVKMRGGPIITRGPNANPELYRRFVEAAKKNKMAFQIEPHPRGTGTDGNEIQLVRGGVPTAILSVPNRYMHSPCELVHLDDVENTARLIALTVAGMTPRTRFAPS